MSMREIKFRAWDKEIKIMSYFETEKMGIQYRYEEFIVSSGWDGLDNPTYEEETKNRYEIMQYTGLKDKNGKEIYEGDIMVRSSKPEGIFYEVVYLAPQFYLRKSPRDNVDVETFDTPSATEEVIGNIYENPELLNN